MVLATEGMRQGESAKVLHEVRHDDTARRENGMRVEWLADVAGRRSGRDDHGLAPTGVLGVGVVISYRIVQILPSVA
jgi:hypothetical protein